MSKSKNPFDNVTSEFGPIVQQLRKEKGWTVRDLIEKLEAVGQKSVSPTYITKIELHGEIPSPIFVCRLAEVFNQDKKKFLDCARNFKITIIGANLKDKYDEAWKRYQAGEREN